MIFSFSFLKGHNRPFKVPLNLNGQKSCEITDTTPCWLWSHHGFFLFYLQKVTIFHFRFQWIDMDEQVVRAQTPNHADSDLTKNFCHLICKMVLSSILGSNELKCSNNLWDHRHHIIQNAKLQGVVLIHYRLKIIDFVSNVKWQVFKGWVKSTQYLDFFSMTILVKGILKAIMLRSNSVNLRLSSVIGSFLSPFSAHIGGIFPFRRWPLQAWQI